MYQAGSPDLGPGQRACHHQPQGGAPGGGLRRARLHQPTVGSKKLEYGLRGPEYGSNRVLIWNNMVFYICLTADSTKLEYGFRVIYGGVPSFFLLFWDSGWSYSHFLASTVLRVWGGTVSVGGFQSWVQRCSLSRHAGCWNFFGAGGRCFVSGVDLSPPCIYVHKKYKCMYIEVHICMYNLKALGLAELACLRRASNTIPVLAGCSPWICRASLRK